MEIAIEVNGKMLKAMRGETILDVLRRQGIAVPTLCHLPGLSPSGSCRICVVEVAGRDELLPSCSQRVDEGMRIQTHTPRVLSARKAIIEMLLSAHPGECLHCLRNGDCELQQLAADLHIGERRYPSTFHLLKKDTSSETLILDHNKCIRCARCVRTCAEVMGVYALEVTGRGSFTRINTVLGKGLNLSACIGCGQCILACPSGAMQGKSALDQVMEVLSRPDTYPVISLSAVSVVSVGEMLGLRTGKDLSGALVTALRMMGFHKVMDMTAGTDLAIRLTAELITERISRGITTPLFSSCCPSWVQLAVRSADTLPGELSPVRSPRQLMSLLASSGISEEESKSMPGLVHISVEPCTARKTELTREELPPGRTIRNEIAITTRDLADLVKMFGIDAGMMEEQSADDPMEIHSYTGRIAGMSGGTVELVAAALNDMLHGKSSEDEKSGRLRGNRAIKEVKISAGQNTYSLIAINGAGNIREAMQRIKGRTDVLFVEVMACPGGCIFGGGQSALKDENTARTRVKALTDAHSKYRRPAVQTTDPLEMLRKTVSPSGLAYLSGRSFNRKELD